MALIVDKVAELNALLVDISDQLVAVQAAVETLSSQLPPALSANGRLLVDDPLL